MSERAAPILTEDAYLEALDRVDALMDAEPGTSDGAELDRLVDQVLAYERGWLFT